MIGLRKRSRKKGIKLSHNQVRILEGRGSEVATKMLQDLYNQYGGECVEVLGYTNNSTAKPAIISILVRIKVSITIGVESSSEITT